MPRHLPRPPALGTLILAAALLAPIQVGAQQVQGRLLDEVDARPLAGAYIVLLRDSTQVASTVTRVDGGFRLVAPEAGSYTLRADQLGYAAVEREVMLSGPGEALRVELFATQQAVELEGLTAEVDRQCDVPEVVAVQVASLWDEVGEAFQVAAYLEEQQLYDLRMDRWERALDPQTLRIQEEARRRGRGIHRGSPFESLPPDDLAQGGYIRETSDGAYNYYGPDARVLLSRSFQDTHCFGVTIDPPSDGDDEWVGIRFEPREDDRPDIRGVLWIDLSTFQPRRLDFRYSDLPWDVSTADVGGRVVFQRLPAGPWIIREWRIRMPVVQAVQYYTFSSSEPRYRYEITRIDEVGGQVTQAGPRGGELVTLGETGSVEGTVTDPGGSPAAGVDVMLEGTIYRARSGPSGRYALEDVPEGRYRLVHVTPLLDSLGLEGLATSVEVRPGEATRVDVPVSPPGQVVADRCEDPVVAEETGTLGGVVRDADGERVGGAEVEISWSDEIDVSQVGGRVAVRQSTARVAIPLDEEGRWVACGLPMDTPLMVYARTSGDPGVDSPVQEVRLREGDLPLVRLTIPDATAVATALAVVDSTDSAEASRAGTEARMEVELANLGVRRETLGRRFAGPERISSVREGAIDAVDMVGVLGLPGIRVRRLRSGESCIYSSRNTRSSPSGGTPEPICAAVVLDGVPADIRRLQSIPGESVAALAYLRPAEAGARFGTGTDGGVLVVWTLRGLR